MASRLPPTRRPELAGLEGADLLVPDGTPLAEAFERTTDLGIGAHPDDLELMALAPIGGCRHDPLRWFSGVVCTDGAGAARAGRFTSLDPVAYVEQRRREQRHAAELGGYSVMVQLGHPSDAVRSDEGFERLVDELHDVVDRARPMNVYTHSPTDKHETHVAVAAATITALRRLAPDRRPFHVVGCEGWRGLDWLGDHEKVVFDTSALEDLGRELAGAHESQLAVTAYDRAEAGRRRANAVFSDPHQPQKAAAAAVAMDLSPLVHNPDIDPVEFVVAAVDRFRRDVQGGLRRWFP
ncbi:MAG: PIG-L family deacetylase [Acidimicrobiales bacterium]|nr:PIG-L family deacetylase [Acidimicrobiales bacterium]